MSALRHSWGAAERYPFKTERACVRCPAVKVTRHEPGQLPWQEYWLNDGTGAVRVAGTRAPPCAAKNLEKLGAAA